MFELGRAPLIAMVVTACSPATERPVPAAVPAPTPTAVTEEAPHPPVCSLPSLGEHVPEAVDQLQREAVTLLAAGRIDDALDKVVAARAANPRGLGARVLRDLADGWSYVITPKEVDRTDVFAQFTACVIVRALAAVDAKDTLAALAIVDAVDDAPAFDMLRKCITKLAGELDAPNTVVLMAEPIISIPALPAPLKPATTGATPSTRLRLQAVWRTPSYSDGVNDFHPEEPPYLQARAPEAFEGEKLSGSVASGSNGILFYGDRYVVTLRERNVLAVLDATSVTPTPHYPRSHFGILEGSTLFIGAQDFVAAVDAKTGQPLWRSEGHVTHTNFLHFDGLIVAASPTSKSTGTLFVLRDDTGEIIQRFAFLGTPDALVSDGEKLEVRCEAGVTTFKIVRKRS